MNIKRELISGCHMGSRHINWMVNLWLAFQLGLQTTA